MQHLFQPTMATHLFGQQPLPSAADIHRSSPCLTTRPSRSCPPRRLNPRHSPPPAARCGGSSGMSLARPRSEPLGPGCHGCHRCQQTAQAGCPLARPGWCCRARPRRRRGCCAPGDRAVAQCGSKQPRSQQARPAERAGQRRCGPGARWGPRDGGCRDAHCPGCWQFLPHNE